MFFRFLPQINSGILLKGDSVQGGISQEYMELSTAKYVLIRPPPDFGSDFFNYKGINSFILLAVVDDDYCFSFIHIGAIRRCSNGSVFQSSSIFNELERKMLPESEF